MSLNNTNLLKIKVPCPAYRQFRFMPKMEVHTCYYREALVRTGFESRGV